MEESAREGLLVDGTGVPLVEEDSGSVELLDGTRITYHVMAPDDAAALQRFHHRLSERSIYLRFFGAKPELSDRKAGYFTNVDRINRFALVALDPERPEEIIGVVSFDREGTTELASRGREIVRERFLLPRLIADELVLYNSLLESGAAGARVTETRAQGFSNLER
jgi:hypothetical protein